MRSRLFVLAGLLALGACGGTTEVGGVPGVDGGAGGEGGSSSSGSSSSSGASSSSGSGSSSSSGASSSSGSASSSGGSTSSSGGGSAGCPATQPSAGSACSTIGIECEYGDSPSVSCNAVVTCTSSGWSNPQTGGCVTGTCPATYGSVPRGQACMPDGLDCAYAQGQCDCSTLGGPAPMGGAVWQCFAPGNCPEPRPRIGGPCSQANQQCDYGACTGGVALQCTNGYWQVAAVPCPV